MQYKAETAAGAYAGKQVGKAALDSNNQKAAGDKIANSTDNQVRLFYNILALDCLR